MQYLLDSVFHSHTVYLKQGLHVSFLLVITRRMFFVSSVITYQRTSGTLQHVAEIQDDYETCTEA